MSDLTVQSINTSARPKDCGCKKGGISDAENKHEQANGNQPQTGGLSVLSFLPSANAICSVISNAVTTIVSKFTSVIKVVDDVISGKKENITAKEFTTSLKGILDEIEGDPDLNAQLPEDFYKSLRALNTKLTQLSSKKDIQNMNMRDLIQTWGQSRDTRALFAMIQRLRNPQNHPECVGFTDEQLNETSIRSLEALGRAFDEVMSHPQCPERDHAAGQICDSIDEVVNVQQRRLERGRDEDLTSQDRREIHESFNRVHSNLETITSDPSITRFLSQDVISMLYEVKLFIKNFLKSWFIKRQREWEEEEQRKKCVERHEMKKEFDKLCRKKHAVKREADRYYNFMEVAKRKMLRFLHIKAEEENKLRQGGNQHFYARKGYEKFSGKLSLAKEKYESKKLSEEYYKDKLEDISSTAPPPSVCNVHDVGLDFLC